MKQRTDERAHCSRYRRASRLTGFVVSLALTSACSGPSSDGVFTLTPPSSAQFELVSGMLEIHCGTYNCHGQTARNMRIFGLYSVRQDPTLVMGFGATTPQEVQANYESVIALQPEILSEITLAGGAGAADWMVVSKGRGVTHHKGGARLVPGTANDLCLLSWLAGAVDPASCEAASELVPPGGAEW